MALLALDSDVEERLKAEREASGADRYDEVWDGVYHMSPLAGDEHQEITTRLTVIFGVVIDWPELGLVRAGVNVSDREVNWKSNYRIPDVAVFLSGTSARNCDTYWLGGPDFVVEICIPNDESRDKLSFYAGVGVKELLLLDRAPWSLELYKLHGGQLVLSGKSTATTMELLESSVLPLHFRFIPGDSRPRVEVTHAEGTDRWVV